MILKIPMYRKIDGECYGKRIFFGGISLNFNHRWFNFCTKPDLDV